MKTTLDDALDLIGEHSPEYGDELSDHAPMVVEALDRLGRGDRVGPYLERTLPHRRRMDLERSPALGAYVGRFEQACDDIGRSGWELTLAAHLPEIVHGLAGAAFHGTLRVAHAARALSRVDTEPRRRELARALAYARVRAARLPRTHVSGQRSLLEVLEQLEPSSAALAARRGLIFPTLFERAAGHPDLVARVAELSLPSDSREAARQLCAAALRMFVDAEYLPSNTFTLLHAVTGMEAVRHLVEATVEPAPGLARALAESGAHALAAMRVAFVGAWRPRVETQGHTPTCDQHERTVARLDDHAIKLHAALEAMPELETDERARALERWLVRVET